MKKRLFGILIYCFRIECIVRWWMKHKVTIISYHNPSYSVFEKHVKYLNSKYHFISMDDFYQYYCGYDKKLPLHSLIVTFDDGYQQMAELLPLFIHYNIKPTIYCCTDIVASKHVFWDKVTDKDSLQSYKSISNTERLNSLKEKKIYTKEMEKRPEQGLTKNDMQNMNPYVVWGSHTKTHVILPQCSLDEKQDEIEDSKKQLEAILGDTEVIHFAYPSGCYDEESIELLQSSGYKTARTTDAGWNNKKTKPYKLKVIGISDDADMLKFRFQLSGLSMWLQYLKHGSLSGKNNNFVTRKLHEN